MDSDYLRKLTANYYIKKQQRQYHDEKVNQKIVQIKHRTDKMLDQKPQKLVNEAQQGHNRKIIYVGIDDA